MFWGILASFVCFCNASVSPHDNQLVNQGPMSTLPNQTQWALLPLGLMACLASAFSLLKSLYLSPISTIRYTWSLEFRTNPVWTISLIRPLSYRTTQKERMLRKQDSSMICLLIELEMLWDCQSIHARRGRSWAINQHWLIYLSSRKKTYRFPSLWRNEDKLDWIESAVHAIIPKATMIIYLIGSNPWSVCADLLFVYGSCSASSNHFGCPQQKFSSLLLTRLL